MSRIALRVVVGLFGLGLAASACAPASNPPSVPVEREGAVLVNVVDSLFDAGRSPSIHLDKDGNPVISYLLYTPVLKKGEIPPAQRPGDPQPPAVMLAALSNGIWNRTSVTPQKTSPASGDAPEIANANGQAVPGVTTSLALDSQGKHHVAWATPKGLFYSTDSGGTFSAPDKVSASPSFGGSIAVGPDGTVWISFYSTGSLKVAHGRAGNWTIDDVQANAGPASTPATVSAIAVDSKGDPVVAYGDQGTTKVGEHSPSGWTVGQIPDSGGYGVSMALDKDGIPQVSYYNGGGDVHLATGKFEPAAAPFGPRPGLSWQVTSVSASGSGTGGQPDARWSTGIAIDDQGTTYLTWADTSSGQIFVAVDQGGKISPQPITGSDGGANPGIAVSGDGKVRAVAWFDPANANLNVALAGTGSTALAHQLPTLGPPTFSAAPSPTGSGLPCQPDGTTLQIAAPAGASLSGFDTTCLAAPAGKDFAVEFKNDDQAPHDWALFTDSSATNQIGGGSVSDPVSPGQTKTYDVKALQPGQYYFHCDFHPTTMTGTFVVAK